MDDDRTPVYVGPSYKPIMAPTVRDSFGPVILAYTDASARYCRMEITKEQAAGLAYTLNLLLMKWAGEAGASNGKETPPV